MGELPPVRVTIRNFGVWRSALLVLVACTAVALGAWATQAVHAQSDLGVWFAVGLMAGSLGLGISLWKVHPVTLTFDASRWFVSRPGQGNDALVAGALRVSLDFGAWMLLRFTPDSTVSGARPQWLPVQLSALKAEAHLLRCALYSPQRSAGDEAAKDAKVE